MFNFPTVNTIKPMSWFDNVIEQVLTNVVAQSVAKFSAFILPLMQIATIIAFLLIFLGMITGKISGPYGEIITKAGKVTIVVLLLSNASLYQTLVINVILKTPEEIRQIITGNQGTLVATLDGMGRAALKVFNDAEKVLSALSQLPKLLVIGAFFFVGTMVLSMVVFVVDKITVFALSFLACLGPFFLFAWAFDYSKDFFNAWIRAILNFLLVGLMFNLIVMGIVQIQQTLLDHIVASLGGRYRTDIGAYTNIYGLFIILALIFMYQTFTIASTLTSSQSGMGVPRPRIPGFR